LNYSINASLTRYINGHKLKFIQTNNIAIENVTRKILLGFILNESTKLIIEGSIDLTRLGFVNKLRFGFDPSLSLPCE